MYLLKLVYRQIKKNNKKNRFKKWVKHKQNQRLSESLESVQNTEFFQKVKDVVQ